MVQELGKAYFRYDTVFGTCRSTGNIDSSHGDDLSQLYNYKRLVQYSGTKTMVFYSRKSTRSYRFGK